MGIAITVSSLEDMCALMCDNIIPKGENMKTVFIGSKRQYNILKYLQNVRHTTSKELAEVFDVNVRTILRDIKALSETFPIRSVKGQGGGIFLDRGNYVE